MEGQLHCLKIWRVLMDYGISSPNNFSAFPSSGFHPIGAGVPWLPAGAHIGLPLNLNSTADDLSGITKHTVVINDKRVDWNSDCGTTLKEALVFSPEAQKFAIAREVAVLQSGGPVVSAAVAPFCLGGVWVYSVVMKQVFQLHTGPVLLRAAVNILALGIGAVSYFFTSDAVNQWIDYSSDRHAAGLSRDYAKGGVEFYEKILSRNRVLCCLMGEKGKKTFAPSGNLLPAHFLQMKHTPCTSRRDRILAALKEQEA
ncbi:transmembrane protein 177 isoform X2 [Thalassophryne amazonica]|uniref:transmembrane protein 177 isoform X2 n=1 Tax=Thalassophryne amazonica TaxID=390379 RepID=UPI001470948F|nr:transmembrane protein 177 isoform X2 [Thalassophryne amazonica]